MNLKPGIILALIADGGCFPVSNTPTAGRTFAVSGKDFNLVTDRQHLIVKGMEELVGEFFLGAAAQQIWSAYLAGKKSVSGEKAPGLFRTMPSLHEVTHVFRRVARGVQRLETQRAEIQRVTVVQGLDRKSVV